uniref:Uncharacterized protein n=1 Tax=Anas platyrhynchos TaxID=8839 RepID=A0A8B9SV68_ANAPL
TLRLRPPAPLALPHCTRRHTSVGGVPVPAGSIVIPNLFPGHLCPWPFMVGSLPTHFPPPERFLEPGAPWRALALARAELFVFLGHILHHFRLEPPVPGALPKLGVTAGTVLRCPPFCVRLVPCQPPTP